MGAMSRRGAWRVSRVALASALILALASRGASALQRPDDPDPVAVPLVVVSGGEDAPAVELPSGASLMAAVNEYVAARIEAGDEADDEGAASAGAASAGAASSPRSSSENLGFSERISACGGGFADVEALRAVACPSSPSNPDAYNFTAYAEAYAAAPRTFPDSYLTPPRLDSCAAGCLPQKIAGASSIQRIAGALPWRGKCFTAPETPGELVAEPTDGDGRLVTDGTRFPLIADVANRVAPPPSRTDATGDESESPTEALTASAVLYEGQSTFDGEPALIIDYRGQGQFTSFRDEMRHVGCGVWLGKTFLTGPPASLAESLQSAANVSLPGPMTTLIEAAMPKIEDGDAPPHVLDFVLFETAA